VSNPLTPILREREMRFALTTARSRVLVVPGIFRGFDHAALGERLAGELPDLEHVVVVRGSGAVTVDDLDGRDPTPAPGRAGNRPTPPSCSTPRGPRPTRRAPCTARRRSPPRTSR